jgi:Tfp pilus assembly protein PilF
VASLSPFTALDRRLIVGFLFGALVPAFGATHLVVNWSRAERQRLAVEWARQGSQDLSSQPRAAVSDFETALAYAPDSFPTRLSLAKALLAAGRRDEARAQFATLSFQQPANGEINLELARIAAADRDVTAAVRYYDAAIDGTWAGSAIAARRSARLELARWLIANSQPVRAQAELIAVLDDLPQDPAMMTDVGGLLLQAGASNRALDLFEKTLRIDPNNGRAALLAGRIEFDEGNMRAARGYLERAAARGALDEQGRDMLDVSAQVLALDPFAAGIGARGRLDRARRALTIAEARLNRCELAAAPPEATRASIADLAARVEALAKSDARNARDPDFIDAAMGAAFDIERLPREVCGPDSAGDRALAAIATQHNWR